MANIIHKYKLDWTVWCAKKKKQQQKKQPHTVCFENTPSYSWVSSLAGRHGPKPGVQEAEAFSMLEAEAEALTLFKLEAEAEAEAEALVMKPKPKPGFLYRM